MSCALIGLLIWTTGIIFGIGWWIKRERYPTNKEFNAWINGEISNYERQTIKQLTRKYYKYKNDIYTDRYMEPDREKYDDIFNISGQTYAKRINARLKQEFGIDLVVNHSKNKND